MYLLLQQDEEDLPNKRKDFADITKDLPNVAVWRDQRRVVAAITAFAAAATVSIIAAAALDSNVTPASLERFIH